ncbi:hypothetical protein ACWKV8_14550 [Brevundimonas diminuta ATCC 11568]
MAKPSAHTTALADLMAALLALKPAGAKGFEGLLAKVLSAASGRPFRLAKSGLQNGKDGATSARDGQIAFEAKLYTGKLPDNEVLTKITRLIDASTPPDVWFLGATVEVSTQLLDPMEGAAKKNGVAVEVLDWPETSSVPPLAVACAAAAKEAGTFLTSHLADAVIAKKARVALELLAKSDAFEAPIAAFKVSLQAASMGMANAVMANQTWLDDKFSDRARARAAFGQAISPKANAAMAHRPRNSLTASLRTEIIASPSRRVLAVVGGEGQGKTWLVADSWLQLTPRPLALFVSAGDMRTAAAYGEFSYFLINKIMEQTGDDDTDLTRNRWKTRLKRWKNAPSEDGPRFLVCVDGLNQQPRFEWPRWLDDAAAQVADMGGALVITVRRTFFDERLRRSLNTDIKVIDVPEWTKAELDETLKEKGVDPTKVAPDVHARLRNPRILAIAFELLDNAQIQNFTELSVERLLFEHIRTGARDGETPETAEQFARRLSLHAKEILERVKSQHTEDRLIFDQMAGSAAPYILTPDLMAVTTEHFFKPVEGEAGLYSLSDTGLTLALGLALLSALRAADRNGRDAAEELERVLEPVAALDKTAEAVLAAAMAASVDETCPNTIRSALMVGFLTLQNIGDELYDPFRSIVRNAPEAALLALQDAVTTSRHIAHADWLSAALREVRAVERCWDVIARYAIDWLRSYSLAPEVGLMFSARHEGAEVYSKKLAEQTKKLKKRLKGLSPAEKMFLEKKMHRIDGDPSELQREALELIAGRALAPFAEALVACAYSMALNSSYNDPHDQFLALVRFNRIDWLDAKGEMIAASDVLVDPAASSTARWARVQLLRALSREADAEQAKALVEELTVDRTHFPGWRLVEKYCASDPCDPDATQPDNIAETAVGYADLDVAELTKSRSMGSEDHFFRDARPGLARFMPGVAVAKLREYANAVLDGSTKMQRLGITGLEADSAALHAETASRFLKMAADLSSPRDPEDAQSRENWVSAQYSLQIGLPHFDGDAQIDALTALPPHGPPLIKLAEAVRPASPEKLEAALEKALTSNDINRQLVALVIARSSGSTLTARAREIVGDLAVGDHDSVRAIAMDVIAHLDDEALIRRVVDSGWPKVDIDARDNKFEAWYGSLVMIAAAKLGLITHEALLDKTTSELWGHAADMVGPELGQLVTGRLRLAIAATLELELDFTPPVVLQKVPPVLKPGLFELVEPKPASGFEGLVARLNETDEEFEARQKSGWANFKTFQAALTPEQARIMVEDVGSAGVDALIAASPSDARALATTLLGLERRKRNQVANFAMRLAKGLSKDEPALAAGLFQAMAGETGIVRLTFGPAALSLESLSVWGSAAGVEMDALRTARLDDAVSDEGLAKEVLAALVSDQMAFLDRYARVKLQSPVPADQARALMVLGFGLESPLATQELSRPTINEGLISKAREAAFYAYERNRWARIWFEKMAAADDPADYWRYSVLFNKIVDGRFELWEPEAPRTGAAIGPFGSRLIDDVRRRSDRWVSRRKKTLCGDKTPSVIFSLLET